MKRTRGPWLAAVALGALCGCGPGPLVRDGLLNRPLVDQVAQEVSAFRGLPLKAPVPARLVGADEMAQLFAVEIDTAFRPGDLAQVEAVDRHLGLLAPGQEMTALLRELYAHQVAGFYDPRTKTFTVARDAPQMGGAMVTVFRWLTGHDPVGELLVAHELTHALQDQYFGIPVEPEAAIDSHSDRLLAQRAVFEGDATLAGFAHVFGGRLDDAAITHVTDALGEVPAEVARELPDIPAVLRMPLIFQYDRGARFTARALRDGGWAAVDRVQRDPPVSTEQVLHPERYYDHRDTPATVALGGTAAFARDGWKPVLEDTMGELGIRLVLDRMGPPAAESAADGWDGDRLRAFRRGDAIATVWLTAWDEDGDAAEFAALVQQAFPAAHVERRERRVLVLNLSEAPALDAARLAAEVWRRSRVDESDPR